MEDNDINNDMDSGNKEQTTKNVKKNTLKRKGNDSESQTTIITTTSTDNDDGISKVDKQDDTKDIKDTKENKNKKEKKQKIDSTDKKQDHQNEYFKSGVKGYVYSFVKGRESQATNDLICIINDCITNHFNMDGKDNKNSSNSNSNSFMDSFEKELKELRESNTTKAKKNQPYSLTPYRHLKVEGLSFMSLVENNGIEQQKENDQKQSLDVVKIAETIFNEMEKEKTTRSKYISRIMPIQQTCYYTSMLEELAKMIEKDLNSLKEPTTYKVEFRSRHNSSINKMDTINSIAKLVDSKHQVDLSNPKIVILVEVIKSFCAMSIVDNYLRYKNYNINNIIGLPSITLQIPKGTIPKKKSDATSEASKVKESTEEEAKEINKNQDETATD